MTHNEKDLKAFEAIAHEVAKSDAEDVRMTSELQQEARVLVDFARDRIAEMRRAERKERASRPVRPPVRPSIVVLTRDAILTRLGELLSAHPQALLAHRDFSDMSDDDLRSALEDAEATLEQSE